MTVHRSLARSCAAAAGETYELATLLSVKMEDVDAFERHIAKTKTLYNDYSTISSQGREVIMPKSERQNLILGLNLLFLLSQNRMAEFHTELELIPVRTHAIRSLLVIPGRCLSSD